MKTVIGVEYDDITVVAIKLKKKSESHFSIENHACELIPSVNTKKDTESSEHINSDNSLINALKMLFSKAKFNKRTPLAFVAYLYKDVQKYEISCTNKDQKDIDKHGIKKFITAAFMMKKYPNTYKDILFEIDDDLANESEISVMCIEDSKFIPNKLRIAKALKRKLAVCDLDRYAIDRFVKKFLLDVVNKNTYGTIFLGLYSNKIQIFLFSKEGEIKTSELIEVDNNVLNDNLYVDEVLQFLLRFIDFMSLDFYDDKFSFDEETGLEHNPKVYIYGLKSSIEDIKDAISSQSGLDCSLIDPLQYVIGNNGIKHPHRYLIPISLAIMWAAPSL